MNPLWTELAAAAGLSLPEERQQLLDRYLDLLLEANAVMNLTRIDDRAGAEVGHIADSLTLLPHLPPGPHRLVDVGSGGGVPGLPLAIARPDVQITLVEATQKKAAFLTRTAAALGLANVKVLAERAETVAHGPLRESFDVAVARAVGVLNLLAEWCVPMVRKGGKLLAMKGARIVEELPAAEKALRILACGPAIVHAVKLPGAEHHVIVEIPKLGRTEPRYPRPASQAKNKPL
jgi:16S rRNA (guanine527-N7)-methyltransferase